MPGSLTLMWESWIQLLDSWPHPDPALAIQLFVKNTRLPPSLPFSTICHSAPSSELFSRILILLFIVLNRYLEWNSTDSFDFSAGVPLFCYFNVSVNFTEYIDFISTRLPEANFISLITLTNLVVEYE